MKPVVFIRKHVLGVTQTEFAAIVGVGQATISRWEKDGSDIEPDRAQMARMRSEALRRGKPWDDRWCFEVPASAEQLESCTS